MKNYNFEQVDCANCGSRDTKKLFDKNGFTIVQCMSCGLAYTNPRVSRETAQNIYDQSYFKSHDSVVSGYDDYLKERLTIEATFNKRIDIIINHAPELADLKEKRSLDVGCALGFLPALLRDRGWQSEGVEFSDYAANFARNELNLSVKLGTLNNNEFSPDHYNLVTSWDVIEHSYNPIEDIKIMARLLKKGGYMAIITPNRESLHARIVGSRWVEYEKPEEHLYFFGERILCSIMEKHGMKVVASTTAGKFVTLGFAFNRLGSYSRIFKMFKPRNEGSWINSKYFYINPFDKMFVIAKKL
jgi:2-polyprenyl-3-methyl-5-hydroxy-6-metoxy-1,4-benzoquinol methylase